MFELYDPFLRKYLTQGFGQNANSFYKEHALKGHTGDDWGVPHGTKIPCCADSYIYSILISPDKAKYRAVFTLVETGTDIVYEVSYGHGDEISVVSKTYSKVGDILATVGSTGDVYQGGVKVTEAEQRAGSKKGAHLHLQVRKCRMVEQTRHDRNYLHDGNGILRYKGHYVEIVDFNNGYNGCVDPKPFQNFKVAVPKFGQLDEQEFDQSVDLLGGLIPEGKKGLLAFIKRLLFK